MSKENKINKNSKKDLSKLSEALRKNLLRRKAQKRNKPKLSKKDDQTNN